MLFKTWLKLFFNKFQEPTEYLEFCPRCGHDKFEEADCMSDKRCVRCKKQINQQIIFSNVVCENSLTIGDKNEAQTLHLKWINENSAID